MGATRDTKAEIDLQAKGSRPRSHQRTSKDCLKSRFLLDNYSTSITQIDQELGKVEIKLKSLEAKLIGAQKNSVKWVRSSIDQCEVNIENEQRVRRVCRQVVKVLEELKDHQKDLDWER